MIRLIIEDNDPQARHFVEFARTLPFVKFEEEKKHTFREAVAECNGIPVDEFFDELDRRIDKWPDHA